MKIKLFTIPNILTLSNLLCGSLAVVQITLYNNLSAAFWLVVVAALFDFLDGMAARLLKQHSAIGAELDSLSDVVSFGFVPSMAMFALFNMGDKAISCAQWSEWGAYITFIIVCFSSLRLAKFNIDTEQESSFIGLPTPANALLCMSLGLLTQMGRLDLSAEVIALISVVMALLLIAPIKLIALKFKSFGWQKNRVRYIFIGLCAAMVFTLKFFAIPAIIVVYILISIIDNIVTKKGVDA